MYPSESEVSRNRRAENTAVDGAGYKDFVRYDCDIRIQLPNKIPKSVKVCPWIAMRNIRTAIQGRILVLVKRFLKSIFPLSILAANDSDLTFTKEEDGSRLRTSYLLRHASHCCKKTRRLARLDKVNIP
jgi:hypothetical protein